MRPHLSVTSRIGEVSLRRTRERSTTCLESACYLKQLGKKFMPEGPSIVLLKEAVSEFRNQQVQRIEGNSKVDFSSLEGKKITEFRSFGKNFLVCFGKRTAIRIHFMLFGTYRINERKENEPRLRLVTRKGELNFYACSVQLVTGVLDDLYDWSADVMSDSWDATAARKKLNQQPETLIADALLDQQIFAGVGNIIKNEVLYRTQVHPKSLVGNIPQRKKNEIIREARNYSFDFLEWKRQHELKKHWLAHTRKKCTRDGNTLVKEHVGKTNRRTFFCESCQVFYGP